nr:Fn3-like domain-containing protein [Streptococcus infantarius]
MASIAGRTITVKANSSEKVMITVDARQFAELLTKEMPNGYYLEGFVRFLDSVDFAEVVSLPFVGFRGGDFQNLAVVEDPVYKLVSDGKEGFYLEIDGDHIVSGSDDTTALLTNSTDSSRQIVLGTYANNAGDFVLHLDENGTTRLAISPNNDGKQDFVAFKGVFLRNYTVELALYDTDAAELAGPTSQIIKLSDADSYKTVNFYVHMRNQAALVLDFDKELPKGTTVSISNKNGKLTVIPAARYAKKDYGKNVYVGDYTLELPLPVGYELYEDPHFTVVYGKQNHIAFSIIDKTALIAETQAINGIENEARYYNASLEKLLAYRDALTSAQAILSVKYTQVEVDAALQTLQDAIEALDGKTTDFKALTEEDSQFQAEQEDPAYYNAGVAARTTYDTQHRKVNLVLAKGSVTQEEVDATLKKLKSAREALDGKATDFRALSNLSNKSKVLKVTSAKYKNASEPAKTAYNQALVEAQAVLSNSEATQGEVDAALANLKAAEAELDGKEKQTTSTQTELNDFIPKEVIKSETPPQSMRTQSASEKGGEVVALGVNKRGLAGKSASALKQSKETAYLPTTSSQSESFLVSLGFIILAGVSLIWKN